MEGYILDDLYRRIENFDNHISFIWTERYAAYGDFELKMVSTNENRTRFKIGTRLAIDNSRRVMTVETVEDSLDIEGRRILTLTGRSLEQIMENRAALNDLTNLTTDPVWIWVGTPKGIATQMFHQSCVLGNLSSDDIIPLINEGSDLYPVDTIVPSPDLITHHVKPKSLYLAEKELCNQYDLGFRLIRNEDESELWFDIYTGCDRTSSQTTFPAVIFSADFENLNTPTELTTISLYKNVAYVMGLTTHEIVYAEGVDPTVSGFDRRVLLVIADDIDPEDPEDLPPLLIARGKEELAKNRRLFVFDGELNNKTNSYVYGEDYNLGDLVEFQNSDGYVNYMKVVEQIFMSDESGFKSYPTLSINKFITPGSWESASTTLEWADEGPSDYWADA